MSVAETKNGKRSVPPPIVTSNKALKLGERNNRLFNKKVKDKEWILDSIKSTMGWWSRRWKDNNFFISDLARNLNEAEIWVNNMTKVADDETMTEVDVGSRPSRLGLGAKVVRQTRVANMNDPLERTLVNKLRAGKRKDTKVAEESMPTSRDDSDDDETTKLDSRTSAFAKKRPATTHVLPQRGLKKSK